MMNFEEWQNDISKSIKTDSLWKMSVYRYALFLGDLGWYDVTKLQQDRRTLRISDQMYRALGSISANVAEGYSRGSNKERAHFYEYSLGSARESRDWYHKGRAGNLFPRERNERPAQQHTSSRVITEYVLWITLELIII